MTEELVEKVARGLLALKVEQTDESWQRYRSDESWHLFENEARAIIPIVLEDAAKVAKAADVPISCSGMAQRKIAQALQETSHDT